MKKWNYLLVPILVLGLAVSFIGCSKDEDNGTTPTTSFEDQFMGTWLSTGENVAAGFTSFDSLLVTFNDDMTIETKFHIDGVGWTTWGGAWEATESETGTIHSVTIQYTQADPVHDESGIIQVVEGSPDVMTLEVYNTALGLDIPTPEDGFGGTALGDTWVQTYVRYE